MRAPNAAKAWPCVQQERNQPMALTGGTATSPSISGLVDAGGQGLEAGGCLEAVPEFSKDTQVRESGSISRPASRLETVDTPPEGEQWTWRQKLSVAREQPTYPAG
jgi:hypothetical protein